MQEAALDEEEDKVAAVDEEEEEGHGSVNRDLFGATFASAAAAHNGDDSSSDSDKNLTLAQLGGLDKRENESSFKTTGDVDFTAWQVLRSEMSNSTIIDYPSRLHVAQLHATCGTSYDTTLHMASFTDRQALFIDGHNFFYKWAETYL